ncbi:Beta-secretase 2, partial [Kappamyces sp. JEL0680]
NANPPCVLSNASETNGDISTRPKSCQSMNRVHDAMSSSFSYTFQVYITIKGTSFLTQVDSGSWIGAWPYGSVSGYSGPSIAAAAYSIPGSAASTSQVYGDGSSWTGKSVTLPVTLNGTTITSSAVISLIQTSDSFLSDSFQGILGIAMDGADYVGYKAVPDYWYEAGVMPSNRIAIHGCPLAYASEGYIDFGDETAYSDCGGQVAKVQMPPESGYYEVNFTAFAVGGISTSMGTGWQTSQTSIIDSGTSMLLIPSAALTALQVAVYNSKGIAGSSADKNNFIYNGWLAPTSAITWAKLPNITLTLVSYGSGKQLDLVLGPRQYIIEYEPGYFVFSVGSYTDFAILGAPLHMAFHLVLDRDNRSINFQLGCGCSASLDGYPQMIDRAATSTTALQTGKSTTTKPSQTIFSTSTLTTPPASSTSRTSGVKAVRPSVLLSLVLALAII